MPKFSIITVCKNSELTISRTIESVLNQTYKDFEYIIVDGKSTDNTMKIVNSYNKKTNANIVAICEDDSGIYEAINKGIKIATGEWIGIIMSQDWYEEDTLENVNNILKKIKRNSIVYGMCRILNEKLETTSIVFNTDINFRNGPMMHEACFISKYCYEKNGLYNLDYKYASDLDLLYKYKNNGVDFVPVEKVLANFSLGGASSKVKSKLEGLSIRKKYGYINMFEYLIRYIYILIKEVKQKYENK